MGKVTAFFRNNIRQYGMVLALVFIMALFQVLTGGILFRPMNITNLVLQNSYVLILGVGMLLCIVTGNVDLSVGSVVAFVGAVAAVFMIDMHMPVLPGIILTLLVGLAVGAFHGYFIAYKKVPPFIVTLAGMLIFRGLTMVILRGQTKAPFDKSIQNIAAGYLPGDLNIAGFNAIAIACGLVLSAVFIAVQMNMRKRKRKYDFEVLPIGLEIV